ncbi:hypothetical protein L3X38_002183 [Prunus dulcis]|uniref:Uncharacterized protein n=1 Tax=Prunus dulcis TaxID=3755 RepID=A0AAD4ZKW2_PRUDU|nr:hypothetical protein L3X38_002183 [Prunus dulcis]
MVFGFAPSLMFTVCEQNKAADALATKSYDFLSGLRVLDMKPFFLNDVLAADASSTPNSRNQFRRGAEFNDYAAIIF